MSSNSFSETSNYLDAPDCRELGHVPGHTGWPLLGNLLPVMKDLHGFLSPHIERYGEPSKFALGPRKGLLVTHPDHLQQVLLDKDSSFSSDRGYTQSIGDWYGDSLIMQDFADHRRSRRIFQGAFKSSALKNYVELMNPIISKSSDNWDRQTDFRFAPAVKRMLIEIAAGVFFGIEAMEGDQLERLAGNFYKINDIGLLSLVKREIPGLRYYTGMQGKRALDAFLLEVIAERRQNPGKDLTSVLVQELDEDGKLWADEMIRPQLSLLLFAAHDTTAGAMSHALFYLAQPEHREWQERLREQALQYPSDHPAYEDLDGMVDLEHSVLEALRLHPAVGVAMRRTIREVRIGNVDVPAHTLLYNMPHRAQRHPDYWTHPNTFDPERFAEPRKEHKNHPFAFLPFGGGAHKCIGMHVALLNAKLALHQLLRKYRFSLPEDYDRRCEVLPLPYPSKGLPLNVTRL